MNENERLYRMRECLEFMSMTLSAAKSATEAGDIGASLAILGVYYQVNERYNAIERAKEPLK